MERATEESTEGEAMTSYAEDTAEDSVGPGTVRDRAHMIYVETTRIEIRKNGLHSFI